MYSQEVAHQVVGLANAFQAQVMKLIQLLDIIWHEGIFASFERRPDESAYLDLEYFAEIPCLVFIAPELPPEEISLGLIILFQEQCLRRAVYLTSNSFPSQAF